MGALDETGRVLDIDEDDELFDASEEEDDDDGDFSIKLTDIDGD